MMLRFEDILAARERISPFISRTPLDIAMSFSDESTKIFLKLECQQKQKAFKVRGALSKISSLGAEEKQRGIYAVSSGNHGAGVSYAASLLGVKSARVYVPETAPLAKVEKILYYGAAVIKTGKTYDETHQNAMADPLIRGLTYINPGDDVLVAAGQGTVGLEILEQNPDIDIILVPVGGGGLITGIGLAAKHIKPGIEVIGVQTEACPAMSRSLADKVCYEEYPTDDSLCDALVGGVFRLAYDMAEQCIDDVIVVKESTIAEATARLLLQEKVVAEPSSATGIAALLEQPDRFKGKSVAVVISGGNLDGELMRRMVCANT